MDAFGREAMTKLNGGQAFEPHTGSAPERGSTMGLLLLLLVLLLLFGGGAYALTSNLLMVIVVVVVVLALGGFFGRTRMR